jgi:hypothetical protein
MSFKVAIVCEDPTYDRYIAEPVVIRACAEIGRPRAQVKTVTWPRVGGVSQLKDAVCEFLEKWGPISNAVVILVDADGEDGEGGRPDRGLQFRHAVARCPTDYCHVVVVALQELEVWALWGIYQQLAHDWSEIREERDPKERFFQPQQTDVDQKTADGGRTRMIEAALAKGWPSITIACPELNTLALGLGACL